MYKKITAWLCAALAVLLLVSACSSAKGSSSAQIRAQNAASYGGGSAPMEEAMPDSPAYSMAYENEKQAYDRAEESADSSAFNDEAVGTALQPEKIIQTARITMMTDRFDEAAQNLQDIASINGGFVENSNLYYNTVNYTKNLRARTLEITLRIPAEFFEAARLAVEQQGHVTTATQQAENVSAQYYDMAGRLEIKKIEEARVLEMITRAEKLEDLLALEQRLGEIRTAIEVYQSQMNNMDRLSAYATLQVRMEEVTQEDLVIISEGLGGRIQRAFIASINGTVHFFQELVIFLAGVIIPLLLVGILLLAGIKTAVSINNKEKKKRRDFQ